MNRFRIIEELIEKATGRIVNGEAVWEELERAVGQYEGEDGRVTVTGRDDLYERWDYYIDLHRNYDEEYDEWEINIRLLEISILNRKTHKTNYIEIQGATL